MKRLFILFLLAYIQILEATPCGNPSAPSIIKRGFIIHPEKWVSLRIGYEGNFISDKRLLQNSDIPRRVNKFEQDLNSATVTLNLLRRLDLYGIVGASRLKADWIIEEGADKSYIQMETGYELAWSAGAKAIFFEWGDITFSIGGRYFETEPDIRWLNKKEETYTFEDCKMSFTEWQIDAGISYKIGILFPYVCGKYSKAKSKLAVDDVVISSDGGSELYLKSKNRYGMALGTSFSNRKYFFLNIEVRLIDEEAFTVSGDIKF